DLEALQTGARHQNLLRHGHPRLGDLLEEIPELRQALRGEGHSPRRRHDRKGPRPDSRVGQGELARHPAGEPPGLHERGRGQGVRGVRQAARLLPVPHHPRRDVRARGRREAARQVLPRGDARHRRALDADGRGEAGRHRHRVLRQPRQRRPVRGRRDRPERQGRPPRRGPGRRVRPFPDGLDRLGQPHPVGHLQGGGRARPEKAHREDDLPGNRAAGADRLQLPLPAPPDRPRRRAGHHGRHAPQGRGPLDGSRRLHRRQGGHRGGTAGASAARAHPRGAGEHQDRTHALHQPGELLRAGSAPGRRRRPRRRQEGQAVRTHQRI
ncbi:MAG: Cacineurin superfamily phosphoesterase, partial [uncultured Rubrobacteraceae bacterium]